MTMVYFRSISALRTSVAPAMFAAGCLLLLSGCGGSPQADVAGRVTIAGAPVVDGQVNFRPALGTAGPEFSGEVVNGEYRVVKSVLPGKYTVHIRSWHKTGRTVRDSHGEMSEEVVNGVPERYWNEESDLTADLKPGDNTANFALTP